MDTNTNDNENSSRRGFIKKGLTLGVGATLIDLNANSAITQSQIEIDEEKPKRLMGLFGLKYPIFQAAPGGEELCIAVANAGAMGAISLTWSSPEEAFKTVAKIKAATKGSFYANYILHFEPQSLDKALEAGASFVQFSWGIPNKEIVSKVKNAKAKLGIQVASKHGAKLALDTGADFLICQGMEAGGHVQANSDLYNTLHEVIAVAKNIPVLASGGIATGHDIRKAIKAGASGAVLGTRFIATKESDIHDEYKDSLVKAGENSTVFTNCFDKEWSALHRVLKNKTFQMWEAVGCPLKGNKPGENDVVATGPDGSKIERYGSMPPLKGLQGSLTELAMYAGQGVHKINDLPTAKELIQRLWKEYENK
jgi:nitronate monooxygenase